MYIDKSNFEVDSRRDYGYAKREERGVDKKDWQAKGRVDAIGALLAGLLLVVTLFLPPYSPDLNPIENKLGSSQINTQNGEMRSRSFV